MKLVKYLKKYWFWAIISPLLMVGEVAVDLMQPKLMSKIVNEGVLLGDLNIVINTGLVMLGLTVVGGLMGIACAGTATIASQNFGNDLRVDVYKKVMGFSIEQTDKFTTGSLVTRLTNDVSMVQDLVSMILRIFVRSPIMFIGGIVMALSLNVNFGLILLVILPIEVILTIIIISKSGPMFSLVQKKLDKVNSVVQENVSGARVIKAYVREDYENKRLDKANRELNDVNYKVLKLMALIMPLVTIMMNLSIIAIILIGGYQSVAGNIEIGDIMAAITYVTMILISIMMISVMFQTLSRASASSKRIVEVLESDPVIVGGEYAAKEPVSEISFKNVSFRYPASSGREVLTNINLDIKKGETVAIIGSTGSGKSSLVNLLPRFYDVTEGEILIGGVNIKDYELEEYRKKIGFVMQKSELFSGTVADNIRWGKSDATDEEVIAAAKIAQADEFISSFPDGYNTYIAEKGASLSGGQKQRISIARAVVRHPEILILDDSTSALDLATEAKLQSALHEYMQGMTVIIIAQRIASVKNADRIAVIENGTITDCAPHDELLKISASYRDIYNSQMKNGGSINE